MKKREVVKSNNEFNYIINNGKKMGNKYFTIFYLDNNLNTTLFGITVSKKTGNAVVRNKLKRQVRSIIDENKLLFKKGRKYIIIIKKTCLLTSYEEINNSLKHLIGEQDEK